jgi:hypothetical protein
MALTNFEQGSVITCEEGILLITNGSVEVSFGGHISRFEKGEMIGLCGVAAGGHNRQRYTALTDVTAIPYPCQEFEDLSPLPRDNPDAASLLVKSMVSQLTALSLYRDTLKRGADDAYKALAQLYPEYERLSSLYAFTSKKLPGIEEVLPFTDTAPEEGWLHEYYKGIKEMAPAASKGFFYGNPAVSLGFLNKSAEDMSVLYQACGDYQEYLNGLVRHFINDTEHDLFALLTELHINSFEIRGADTAVEELVKRLTDLLFALKEHYDPAYFQNRLNSYKEALSGKRASKGSEEPEELPVTADAPAAQAAAVPKRNLSDSLDHILSYSECPEELCIKFTRAVREFVTLPDRTGADDVSRKIRKDLTEMFYNVYKGALIKSLNDPAPSTIIKMFLNFGYVDAALAGFDNADYLYSVADSLKGDKENGVYTALEWLTAIYKGEKEPNRNEFDMDYGEYLHDLKVQGRIGEVEEKKRLNDLEGKLRFELDNVFPITNKITFGRITTFCPLFSSHTVLRNLEMSMVTASKLKELIGEIRAVDFSAYTREILYSNPKCGVTNETLHVEVLPDIILMPNVGIRGAMWQEIEGRKRGTPARIFMPLFLEGDLKKLVIRLTGEFRWEMCKRVQGMRWNDITNPSLTSEFSDYLQFYRNNKEITMEMREDIKAELTAAKKNYKNVFVSNYHDWIIFESQGAPRLNKWVLRFMIKYCPFPVETRTKLLKYPRYAELLTRQNAKMAKRTSILLRIIHKIEQNVQVKQVPQELVDEFEFSKK